MKYRITHSTKYSYSQAVPVCHNLLHLAPRSLPHQQCDDFQLVVHPEPADICNRIDYFGNHSSYFSIEQPHRGLAVTSKSQVEVVSKPMILPGKTKPWQEIVEQLSTIRSDEFLDAYQFVFASPSIKTFAGLNEYAGISFPVGRPILEAVLDLTARIHHEFKYDPQATTIHTPIQEVFHNRHGVCQDFAHLQIGCLRALGLAARYVSGYLRTVPPAGKPRLIGADASHAWLSVYCGEAGWIDVDPTNNVITSTDHVTVAWGTEYSTVCPIQGVIVGGGDHTMHVSVDVAPADSPLAKN